MQASSRWPSPELAFVARASAPALDPATVAAVRDWSAVLELSLQHRLLPRVWRSARAQIPEPHASQMREHAASNARNALRNVARTLEAVQLLEQHGIRALVLKGPLLAHKLYGDYALRMCHDVDLLVQAPDFVAAAHVFGAAGYQHHTLLTSRSLSTHRRFQHDVAFAHNDDGTLIELHADVAQPHYSYRVDLDEWWRAAESLEVGARDVAMLKTEHAYLLSVLHAAKHQWHRLDLIADIAAFQCLAMDRQLVQSEANAAGLLRVLAISEQLAARCYGAALIDHNARAAQLASKVIIGEEFGRWSGLWLDVRAREHVQDRVRYLIRRVKLTRYSHYLSRGNT